MNAFKFKDFMIIFIFLVSLFLIPVISGDINSKVVEFEVLPVRNYNINLTSGINVTKNWSLISSPLKLINESVTSFVNPIDNNWSALMTYRSWGDFIWAWPGGGGDLKEVYLNHSYWIYMMENDTLEIEGINYLDSIKNRTLEIPLDVGWHIIGYPYNYSQNLTIALDSIWGKWASIWRFCNPYCTVTTGAVSINITGWLGQNANYTLPFEYWDIKQLEPGVGYEIYINESCTLVYNFTTNITTTTSTTTTTIGGAKLGNGRGEGVSLRVIRGKIISACYDRKQNYGEEGVDCGGPCKPCLTTTTTIPLEVVMTTTTIVSTTTASVLTKGPKIVVIRRTTTTTILPKPPGIFGHAISVFSKNSGLIVGILALIVFYIIYKKYDEGKKGENEEERGIIKRKIIK